MDEFSTVFIVGLGDIGEHVLELLTRVPDVSKIYVSDKKEEEWCMRKIYSAISGAIHQGFSPKVDFVKLDLNDIETTATALRETKPDVAVSAVTLKTWWAPQASLPADTFRKLDAAGFGPWIPFHFTLAHKLMQAVKKANIDVHVINCSFPDAVNAILGKLNMAPTVGIGNCDLFVPWLRKIVADRLKVAIKAVAVYLVAHHFLVHALNSYQCTWGCPYYLKITIDDKDVTDQFKLDELLVESNKYMPKGQYDHFIVAASAVKNILHILNDTNELTYAPGPEGLPGGYPTRLSRKGARIALPAELPRQEAIRINEESQKFDGIEKIRDDGTVVFTQKAVEIMHELLGYDCSQLKPEESDTKAKELMAAYDRFASRFVRK